MTFVPFHIMKHKYLPYFAAVASKTALNPVSLVMLSYDIINGNKKLLKQNNFFGLKPKDGSVFHNYNTPFTGIKSGIDLIQNHKNFTSSKVGTLKANEIKQYQKMKELLNLSTY